MSSSSRRRVVLVGGGHAHLRVIRSIREHPWPAACTLVSPAPAQFYSGMVPGFLQGTYTSEQIRLDLVGLCEQAGIDFVQATARAVDTRRRIIETDAGDLDFDLASIDVGSVPAGLDLPGVREHALALRPMARALELRTRIDELAQQKARQRQPARLAVVGAGAAGFEVALALQRRVILRGARANVTLLESGPRILGEYSERVRRRAERLLVNRGISWATGSSVREVNAAGLSSTTGATLEADAVVWTTGPAAPPLLARSTLPLSADGYLEVDASLRAADGVTVWGAGDCASVEDWDLPKAGVYAVRQGPILARNLGAFLTGEEPIPYHPQTSFLSLLNTADGRALLRWKRIVSHSRLAWWLKDRIDRGFVDDYRA